jgi:hypothetical protein
MSLLLLLLPLLFVPRITQLYVYLKHGEMTCVMITIFFSCFVYCVSFWQGVFRCMEFCNFTDVSKLESIQRKFLALCQNRFFLQIHYSYVNVLKHLNFHILSSRRRHLDALFLVNVYTGFKFCPSLCDTVGIHVPVRNFRDFPELLVPYIKWSLC